MWPKRRARSGAAFCRRQTKKQSARRRLPPPTFFAGKQGRDRRHLVSVLRAPTHTVTGQLILEEWLRNPRWQDEAHEH